MIRNPLAEPARSGKSRGVLSVVVETSYVGGKKKHVTIKKMLNFLYLINVSFNQNNLPPLPSLAIRCPELIYDVATRKTQLINPMYPEHPRESCTCYYHRPQDAKYKLQTCNMVVCESIQEPIFSRKCDASKFFTWHVACIQILDASQNKN